MYVYIVLFQANAAVYESWQLAKRETREEDHDVLRQKLALQRQLIIANDELAEQKNYQARERKKEVKTTFFRFLKFILSLSRYVPYVSSRP